MSILLEEPCYLDYFWGMWIFPINIDRELIPLEALNRGKFQEPIYCLHKSFAIQCNKRSIVNKPRQHQQLENKLLGMQGIRSEYRSANAIYCAMLPPILICFLVSSTNLFEPSRSRQSWAWTSLHSTALMFLLLWVILFILIDQQRSGRLQLFWSHQQLRVLSLSRNSFVAR